MPDYRRASLVSRHALPARLDFSRFRLEDPLL